MNMISGNTRCYAILGDPIGQALSPIIHNAAFTANGDDAVFLGFQVAKEDIAKAMGGVRAMHIAGLAVTMPDKQAIIPYLDRVDEYATEVGAVNVVVRNTDGTYAGYNTDGDGFIQSVKEKGMVLEGSSVFLIGAGGVARSIAFSLLRARIRELFVCNLFMDEANEMINDLRKYVDVPIVFVPFEGQKVKETIGKSVLVVNATSLGMNGKASPHVDLIPWDSVDSSVIFADVVHSPLKTPFIRRAEEKGCRIVTGDGMLLYQGILAYHLLTGEIAPKGAMKHSLEMWLDKGNERGKKR